MSRTRRRSWSPACSSKPGAANPGSSPGHAHTTIRSAAHTARARERRIARTDGRLRRSSGRPGAGGQRSIGGGMYEERSGWVTFAAVLLMMAGALNVIYGIAAIGDSRFFVQDTRYIIS